MLWRRFQPAKYELVASRMVVGPRSASSASNAASIAWHTNRSAGLLASHRPSEICSARSAPNEPVCGEPSVISDWTLTPAPEAASWVIAARDHIPPSECPTSCTLVTP
jgi:hypothetical protein